MQPPGRRAPRLLKHDAARQLTERYDEHAAHYRELWAPLLHAAGLGILRELAGAPPAPVRRVLEVGAGVGALLPELQRAFPGASVLGLDRSHGMLGQAPRRTRRVVADARAVPVAAGCVDLVLCVFVLFHLDEPLQGLREARRVLRAGGRVGTVTWGSELESRATRLWTACLDEHGAQEPDPATAARDAAVDTPEKLETLLRAAGFASARAWRGDLADTIGLEHLVRLKTRMGKEKSRFDSLAQDAREACVASARRRMGELGPADFVARGKVVYAVGNG